MNFDPEEIEGVRVEAGEYMSLKIDFRLQFKYFLSFLLRLRSSVDTFVLFIKTIRFGGQNQNRNDGNYIFGCSFQNFRFPDGMEDKI